MNPSTKIIDDFLKDLSLSKNVLSSTILLYKKDLLEFFEENRDNKDSILNFSEEDIKNYINLLGEKYKKTTVARKFSVIKNFYKFLVKTKKIEASPANIKLKLREELALKEKDIINREADIVKNKLDRETYNKILSAFESDYYSERNRLLTRLIAETELELLDILDIKIDDLKRYNFKAIVGRRNSKVYSYDLKLELSEKIEEFYNKYKLKELHNKENLFTNISRQKYRLELLAVAGANITPSLLKTLYNSEKSIDVAKIKEEYFKIGIGDD